MSEPASVPKSPFVGLIPFREEDWKYFFGRDAEGGTILTNLLGRRLTLLYGPSGAGKSSVLRALVVNRITKLKPLRGEPRLVPLVYNSWSQTPARGLAIKIGEALGIPGGEEVTTATFGEFVLKAPATANAELCLILDQFEEFFLYQPVKDVRDSALLMELVRLIRNPEAPVNVMLSLREDGLAKLDVLKTELPGIYDNSLRLEYLSVEGAKEAIHRPLARFSEDSGVKYEADADLETELLNQIQVGKVTTSDAAQGRAEVAHSDLIETPYLQLVLMRLWEEHQPKWVGLGAGESRHMTLQTLRDVGDAEGIVRTHLERLMNKLSGEERKVMAALARFLVTPDQGKVAQSEATLKQYVGAGNLLTAAELNGVGPLIQKLQSREFDILRRVSLPTGDRYEVFHDTLGKALVAWQAAYDKEQAALAAAQEEARRQAAEETERKKRIEQLKKDQEIQEQIRTTKLEAARQAERVLAKVRVARLIAFVVLGLAVVVVGLVIWYGGVSNAKTQRDLADASKARDAAQAREAETEARRATLELESKSLRDQLGSAQKALGEFENQQNLVLSKAKDFDEAVARIQSADLQAAKAGVSSAYQQVQSAINQSSRQIQATNSRLEQVSAIVAPEANAGWQTGTIKTFGGPQDAGRLDELALIRSKDEARKSGVFLPNVSSPPKVNELNPDTYYIAARWDYRETPRSWLLSNKVKVRNREGKIFEAQAVDWGPSLSTGNLMDLSPGLAAALGLAPGQEASFRIDKPSTPSVPGTPTSTPDTTSFVKSYVIEGINDGRTRAVPLKPGWYVWVGKLDSKDQTTVSCSIFSADAPPAGYYSEAKAGSAIESLPGAKVFKAGLIGKASPWSFSYDGKSYELRVTALSTGLFKNDFVDLELREH